MWYTAHWLWLVSLLIAPGHVPAGAVVEVEDEAPAVLRDYYSANGLLNRGFHDLAVPEYRKFLATNGEHDKAPTARYGLAVCLYRLEQYEAAATELIALRKSPTIPWAAEVAAMLGQCRLATGEHEAAARAFDAVIQGSEDHTLADDAAVGAGEAYYLSGRHDEAISRCQLLVSRWPESPLRERAWFFWGLAAMAQGDHETAGRRFADILQDFPNGPFADQSSLLLAQCHHYGGGIEHAIRQYKAALERAGTRFAPDALLGLGLIALQQGNSAESGRLLDRLLERHPDSALAVQARFHRARAWFEQGDIDRALNVFEQVLPVSQRYSEPPEDRVAYWIAKCKLRQGHYRDAADRLAGAAAKFPKSALLPEMTYDRAIALVREGQAEDGVRLLEDFRQRFPDHALSADVLHVLATVEHERQNYDKSQTHCRTFLQQFPADGRAAQVMFLSAENELLAERYPEAAEGYRLLLSRFPDCAQVSKTRYRLGTVLYRLERFDEAAEALQQVADEARQDETLRFTLFALGDMCFRRSEWKRAERYLSDYLQLGLRVASADDALLKLGLALQRQGDYSEALRAYDRLLGEFAESPHRVQALFERGQVLVALERLDEGKEAFSQVLAAGDGTTFAPHATNHLAAIAMQQDQPQTAAQLLGRLVDGNRDGTDQAESLFKQGQAWFAAGKLEEAEGAFRGFLDRYPAHAQTAEALARLAITLSRLERHADALQSIKRIDGEFAGKLPAALEASVQYEKAWCLHQTGQTEQAADAYQALLAGEVSGDIRIHALLELASIEAEKQRYAQAADLLGQLRQIAADSSAGVPDDVRAQQIYRLGVCEFEMGRLAEAANLFNEFITLFPDSPLIGSASFFCGEAQYQMGKHGQAVGNLTRVIEDFPRAPVFAPSLLRLGQCLSELRRWPRAEEMFAEYVKRFGETDQWYQAQFGLGWARENQGRHDEAIRAYRAVIDRHQGPTAARAQFQVGECLFAKEQYEDAARELLKVDILYAYPQWSAAALYEAGRCFEKLAKLVEARAQFDAVTRKFGDTRWASMASQRLEALSGGGVPGR